MVKVRWSAPEHHSATSNFSRVVLHHLYFLPEVSSGLVGKNLEIQSSVREGERSKGLIRDVSDLVILMSLDKCLSCLARQCSITRILLQSRFVHFYSFVRLQTPDVINASAIHIIAWYTQSSKVSTDQGLFLPYQVLQLTHQMDKIRHRLKCNHQNLK